MNEPQQDDRGFNPHVMDQLQQIAASPRASTRGQQSKKRGRSQYQKFDYSNTQHSLHNQQPQTNQTARARPVPPPNYPPTQTLHTEPYPALVSGIGNVQGGHVTSSQTASQRQHHDHQANIYQQPGRQQHLVSDFAHRGHNNGRYGGRSRGGHTGHFHVERNPSRNAGGDFYRPPPNQGHLFQPGGNPFFGTAEQQRAFRHKIMSQSDFLSSIAGQALRNQISPEEFQQKEAFRRVIEEIAQKVISTNTNTSHDFNVGKVKLKLYGSLGSGFGVAGSDMDLLLTFPQNEGSLNGVDIESRRWLEKGLLDAGYGARLLTNTRVPILKVCQRPGVELLRKLREYRQQWDDSTNEESEAKIVNNHDIAFPPFALPPADVVAALQTISLQAMEVALPETAQTDQTGLEFTEECGIQCDINFTNYVALRNTELLRIYGQCDPRVRQVGLFVKHWAKARDINTPYKGTLSSYGYIMLVLHYLMNIVSPPLIPNLQVIAKDQDNWGHKAEIETIEGFDVRFVRDPEQLHHIMANMPPNHESIGSLLRGFFWYYACNGGFHWTRDVVSIRSRGGQLSKHSKGWTGAKWSESKQNVRLRYLLAIEDPFETEHNIGRTVGHSGIVAIRDEFRRAWSIIETVQLDQMQRLWVWTSKDDGNIRNAEELMETVENRGDLLRRDQVAHRDRMRQMRREAEQREQALRDGRVEDGDTSHETTDTVSASTTTDPTIR